MPPRKYTDDQLREALPRARTMSELLRELGLVACGGNYEMVRARFAALGLDGSHLRPYAPNGRSLRISDDDLRAAVASARSYNAVFTALGGSSTMSGYKTMRRRITMLGLDTSHFTGQSWSRGMRLGRPRVPIETLLVVGPLRRTTTLKQRLFDEGLKVPRCEVCGGVRWMGAPIPLELDHINGRRDDNRLENLRILCPNCHAQTPTYRGRNVVRPWSDVARSA